MILKNKENTYYACYSIKNQNLIEYFFVALIFCVKIATKKSKKNQDNFRKTERVLFQKEKNCQSSPH